MDILIIAILILNAILLTICWLTVRRNNSEFSEFMKVNFEDTLDRRLKEYLLAEQESERRHEAELRQSSDALIINSMESTQRMLEVKLNTLTQSLSESFGRLRNENSIQIDRIRQSVNERLDKSINEQFERSFKGVITQMNDLQRSMGELKSISGQVGSLEKTLNGVKTRGIMGEVQLKNIISDVLTPSQYETEFCTIPGSSEHVEIAIKLPNRNGDGVTYLPVDSKCHTDRYEDLINAYESADSEYIKRAKKAFAAAIIDDARTIRRKYVRTPDTTPYAILFVPFEGMYSEIVNLNIIDTLNREEITVAGPYTFMAVLSTVTNYFQALAIEKKSVEIERTLGKVKSEFAKYNSTLELVRKNLDTASRNLEILQTTRTNTVNRALKEITSTDYINSGLPEDPTYIEGYEEE